MLSLLRPGLSRTATPNSLLQKAVSSFFVSRLQFPIPSPSFFIDTYTGKDVHQAAFTAHLSAQKPVGFKLSNGSALKTKDRHPKEFENRLQGPAHAQTKPLPDISSTGTKYREYGILHNKKKGYDGRSPNPTEARLITKPNAHGVHEFVGVVAHPDSTGPDMNDHHLVHPSH